MAELHRIAAASPDGLAQGGTGEGPYRLGWVDARPSWVPRPRWRPARVGFVVPGQGPQFGGMAQPFYEAFRGFREVWDGLQPLAPEALERALHGNADALEPTRHAQPALFAFSLSIARVLADHGVHFDVIAGHSLGEYAAAVLADAVDREAAMNLVLERSRLLEQGEPGVMAQVRAPLATVRARLPDELEIAAINAPDRVVVAGTGGLEVLADLEVRQLSIARASHCRRVDPILDAIASAAASTDWRPPSRTWLRGSDGRVMGMPDAQHWRRHIRAPVDFVSTVRGMADQGVEVCVELGPTPALSPLVAASAPELRALAATDAKDPVRALLSTIATLWTLGVPERLP